MKRFNIRVYGLLVNDKNQVLVSDERRGGNSFTKLPGGGLEFGEGTRDCLIRELSEELNITAEIGDLFYVNDFYQQSAFRADDQLISFYYRVLQWSPEIESSTDHPIPMIDEGECFRWVPIDQLTQEMFTFPIDKVVAENLRTEKLN